VKQALILVPVAAVDTIVGSSAETNLLEALVPVLVLAQMVLP
jgi:hypothetical protein